MPFFNYRKPWTNNTPKIFNELDTKKQKLVRQWDVPDDDLQLNYEELKAEKKNTPEYSPYHRKDYEEGAKDARNNARLKREDNYAEWPARPKKPSLLKRMFGK